MALASVLQSESVDFSNYGRQRRGFASGLYEAELGLESVGGDLSFALRTLCSNGDGPDRKIEFLHGTTTLAFKVSLLGNFLCS